jgi:hypothetical protein
MYTVEHDTESDRVAVYKDGVFVGVCEAYELDAICQFLNVQYKEVDRRAPAS